MPNVATWLNVVRNSSTSLHPPPSPSSTSPFLPPLSPAVILDQVAGTVLSRERRRRDGCLYLSGCLDPSSYGWVAR